MITAEGLMSQLNDASTVELPRGYLGLSGIGNKCYRALQYHHYQAYEKSYDRRTMRLLNFGHKAEAFMIEDLESLGFTFLSNQSEVTGFGGHWKGHDDGIMRGPDQLTYLAEFKTHNDKNFKALKKGDLESAYPVHKHQVNSYMGYNDVAACIYMGYNKNNSEYHIDIVEFDPNMFIEDKLKEEEIVLATELLPKIGPGTSTWFECKLCDARLTCYEKVPVLEHCRTCANVNVLPEGEWQCNLSMKYLSPEEQQAGCDKYGISEIMKWVN